MSLLSLPAHIRALVFDVDGVLLDTLGADYDFCVAAAKEVLGDSDWLKRDSVAKHFALDTEAFWRELVRMRPNAITVGEFQALTKAYEARRAAGVFKVLDGAETLIAEARAQGLKVAVASSNQEIVLRNMLTHAGLADRFAAISALGAAGVEGKPAPDLYLRAAEMIDVAPAACAFIEDSLTGLQAGRAAGYAYAIAVATGSAPFATLAQSSLADIVFDRLAPARLAFIDGKPTDKRIDTPNDFVSHMIEHIAWRIGAGIDLSWRSDDWKSLGRMVGVGVHGLGLEGDSAATLGMIDDGAAEVMIDRASGPGVDFDTHPSLPRAQVLSMRVEQVHAGEALIDLMQGLAEGLGAHITVRMCTFEDPHHSWEGVYRAIGICLSRLRQVSARSAA